MRRCALLLGLLFSLTATFAAASSARSHVRRTHVHRHNNRRDRRRVDHRRRHRRRHHVRARHRVQPGTLSAGSNSATSAQTTAVAAPAGSSPANTAPPKITGVPTVGDTLAVSDGTWSNAPSSFSYQWQDCNASGASCTGIAGATAASYVVASTDTASSIRAVVTAQNTAGTASASGVTGPAPVFFNRLTYQYTSRVTTSQEASRYQFLNLQTTDGGDVAALLSANPHLTILPYIDSIGTKDGDTAGPGGTAATSCTTYATDASNATAHPGNPQYDWFLYTGGNVGNPSYRALYPGTTNQYLMDVGNPYYEAACWAHSLTLLQQYGWTAVYYDNIVGFLQYVNGNGAVTLAGAYTTTAYTQSTWQLAEESLATYLGTQAHSAGYMVIGNVSVGNTVPDTFVRDIAASFDGVMDQSWIDGDAGPAQQDHYWRTAIDDATWSEANHKYFWAVPETSSSPSEGEYAYGLAATLLAMNGYTSYSTSLGPAGSCYGSGCVESWFPENNIALQLGPAVGPYQTSSSGGNTFYERDFANGVVVVNPSPTAISAAFAPAPGGLYSGFNCNGDTGRCSSLSNASSLALSADGGAILLKSG
jgi:Hypothetical glycosyl hydrolase family 15